MENNINSKIYWDKRFEGDWEERRGREQTNAFYALLLRELPEFIAQFIETKTKTINDIGCALGEGTKLIQNRFSKQIVEGTDFSSEAIKNAKKTFPNLKFSVQDINDLPKSYDVMIASNVVEHFKNPISILAKIIKNTKKIAIIMLPFKEDTAHLVSEHTQSFNFNDFPIVIKDSFLLYSKEIDMAETKEEEYWHGKQILLIYCKENVFSKETLLLSNYHACNFDKDKRLVEFSNKILNYENQVQELSNTLIKRQEEISSLQQQNLIKKNELELIQKSSAWKTTQSYYRLLEKSPILKKFVRILKK